MGRVKELYTGMGTRLKHKQRFDESIGFPNTQFKKMHEKGILKIIQHTLYMPAKHGSF